MAERKATNKYYPPDWDPSKGSVNRHNNSHPLRDRARKIDLGILTVRFEMPFNIWCLGCNNHIGMGVRYNAEKSKIGNYYTTPIYQFKMKCRMCGNHIVLKTDPSKFDYAIVSGFRKQAQPVEDDDGDRGLIGLPAFERAEEAKRRLTDSMLRLERKIEDKMSGDANQPNLRDLKRWCSRRDDGFSANKMVRAQFRLKRKSLEQAKERDKRLLRRTSLKIPLAKPSLSDRTQAEEIAKRIMINRLEQAEKKKRADIFVTDRFFPKTNRSNDPSTSTMPPIVVPHRAVLSKSKGRNKSIISDA